mmetsp:Transcript_7755/g.24875  ORF Transcript_7755/g.24875 Transcript_7755/m.24875 type:complete len:200 (-) Transcript_7755:1004-1603(-)
MATLLQVHDGASPRCCRRLHVPAVRHTLLPRLFLPHPAGHGAVPQPLLPHRHLQLPLHLPARRSLCSRRRPPRLPDSLVHGTAVVPRVGAATAGHRLLLRRRRQDERGLASLRAACPLALHCQWLAALWPTLAAGDEGARVLLLVRRTHHGHPGRLYSVPPSHPHDQLHHHHGFSRDQQDHLEHWRLSVRHGSSLLCLL